MNLQKLVDQLGIDNQAYSTLLETGRKNPKDVVSLLLDALKHAEGRVRSNAIAILGIIGDQNAGQAIESLATDRDSNVRRTVAFAVPKLLAPSQGSLLSGVGFF